VNTQIPCGIWSQPNHQLYCS